MAAGVIQNRRAAQSRNRITRLWSEDMEREEVLIEAFGLGRYMGAHCDSSELVIPADIFAMLEERYGVTLDALTRAYVRGRLFHVLCASPYLALPDGAAHHGICRPLLPPHRKRSGQHEEEDGTVSDPV